MDTLNFVLQEWQLVLVGFVATILVQIIRWYAQKKGKPLGEKPIQWFIFGISILLGLWWGGLELPPVPVLTGDPTIIVAALFAYISQWILVGGKLLGVAFIVYKAIAKKIFDAIQPLRI